MLGIGFFAASASGGGAAAYELISTTVLGSNTAEVSFNVSSYASTYKHLQLRYVAKTTQSAVYADVFMRFNADTAANYAHHQLRGNGSTVTSGNATSQTYMGLEASGASATANAFTGGVIDILDPFSTSKNKTTRTLFGRVESADNGIFLKSGLWMSTSAVTAVSLTAYSGNFITGSRFSLYGLRA